MLTPLGELWRARRGRRAAVATISPLVAHSRNRLSDIPELAWREPYMVGFIVMLITLVARMKVKALDTHALALVQCEAWSEITGLKRELIGEEVLHLSAANHKEFMQGCRDAVEFRSTLGRRPATSSDELVATWGSRASEWTPGLPEPISAPVTDPEVATASELWEQFFEARVSAWRSASAVSIVRAPLL